MSVSEYVMEFLLEGSKPRFMVGMPVWAKKGFDQRCYVVIEVLPPSFGAWRVEVVMENDPTGPSYIALEDYFTDAPPPNPDLHPQHQGSLYLTRTGNKLKAIPGGFPELRGVL